MFLQHLHLAGRDQKSTTDLSHCIVAILPSVEMKGIGVDTTKQIYQHRSLRIVKNLLEEYDVIIGLVRDQEVSQCSQTFPPLR